MAAGGVALAVCGYGEAQWRNAAVMAYKWQMKIGSPYEMWL